MFEKTFKKMGETFAAINDEFKEVFDVNKDGFFNSKKNEGVARLETTDITVSIIDKRIIITGKFDSLRINGKQVNFIPTPASKTDVV